MNEEHKWVNISRQEIIFDEQKCLLLSFRDVSAAHQLKLTKRVAKRSQNQGATLKLPKKTHMKKILQRHPLVIHGVRVIVGTGGSHS